MKRHQGSTLATLKAVAWSFIGIRRSRDHAQDIAHLNPAAVIGIAILGAASFVGSLIFIVSLVTP